MPSFDHSSPLQSPKHALSHPDRHTLKLPHHLIKSYALNDDEDNAYDLLYEELFCKGISSRAFFMFAAEDDATLMREDIKRKLPENFPKDSVTDVVVYEVEHLYDQLVELFEERTPLQLFLSDYEEERLSLDGITFSCEVTPADPEVSNFLSTRALDVSDSTSR